MSKRLDFIPDDGYTEEGYIKAEPFIHGELRFRFRPRLVEEKSQILDQADAAGRNGESDKFDQRVAKMLSLAVAEWSLKDSKGGTVAISARTILQLKPRLNYKLYQIVMGMIPTDIDPNWPAEKQDAALDQEYESALSGKSPAAVREEGSLGN
jgi:hypothetical protein